jgi:hypothetical protein
MSSESAPVAADGYEFALCLTHDVDRPYKTVAQSLYYALRDGRLPDLSAHLRGENPYWQFEDLMELEDDLGVRSALYFLTERRLTELSPSELFDPSTLVQQFGRYDVQSDPFRSLLTRLDEGGWEVGFHGSFPTATDRERLDYEKRRIEEVLDRPVLGGRQHYLRLAVPTTWHHYADVGLRYDASLGSATDYGFEYGYDVRRPFDDDFVVFPLTVMETTLPDPGSRPDDAWAACEDLLDEAAANDAVMTALWHPRYFNDDEFPGYRRLYRRLVEAALDRGAWVGSPGELYCEYLESDVDASPSAVGANDFTR